ncbi:MAG: AtpZ/AtpI family protein [Planctomycetota bacterium]|nr:AtpZ/AtpI family protein [Planctomycetota bacterium]
MGTHLSGLPRPEHTRYAGLGIQFAGTIAVVGLIGWWLDGKLGTMPWLLIVGIFTGFIGGLVSMVKQVPGPRSRPDDSKHTKENRAE